MEIKIPIFVRHIFFIIVFAGLVIYYFYSFLFEGKVIYESDVPVVGYPTRYYAAEQLKQGEFPHWNPYYYFGYPFFAESQAGVLFPLNLIFLFLPLTQFTLLYHWLTAIHFLLAGLFFYLWLIELVKKPELAFWGAISFTFSGFMVSHIFHLNLLGIILFFPLQMWCYQRFLNTGKNAYLLVIPPTIAFQVFSGQPPMVAMSFLIMFLYAILVAVWEMFETDRFSGFRPVGYLLACWVVGVLFASIQWIPTLYLTLQSQKIAMPAELEGHLEWNLLSLLVYPKKLGGFYYERGGYIGLLPLILLPIYAVYAWWNRRHPPRDFWTALFTALFALWLTLGPYSPFYLLLTEVPPYTLIRYPARFLFFFDFFFLSGIVLSLKQMANVLPRKWQVLAFLALLVFQVRDLFWMGYGYTFPVERDFYHKTPKRIQWIKEQLKPGDRILSAGFAKSPLPVRFGEYIWEENGEVVPSEFLAYYLAVRFHIPTVAFFFQPTLIYRRIPLLFNQLMISPNQEVFDAMGIRFLVLPRESPFINPFQEQYEKRYEDEYVEIWENLGSRGRAYLVPAYVIRKPEEVRHPYIPKPGGAVVHKILYTDKNILDYLFSVQFDPEEAVILEEEPRKKVQKPFQNAEIQWLKDTPHGIALKVRADGEGYLVVADAFSPLWRAYMNGKEVPVQVGNYVFRAIYFPGGEHIVEFLYQPKDFQSGLLLSLYGLMAFLILWKWFTAIRIPSPKEFDEFAYP